MSKEGKKGANGKAEEKRRLILDAAAHVFASQGFHKTRVADIANKAGIAYGLVYHYFNSKDEILNTLFSERWSVMLERISEIDEETASARDKLYQVASFIIDSYHHNPDLMKVIIVEVTRAANTFGLAHLNEIEQAYSRIEAIVAHGQRSGDFKDGVSAQFASLLFYGAIEQLLSGWIFGSLPQSEKEFEHAKQLVVDTICEGLENRERGKV